MNLNKSLIDLVSKKPLFELREEHDEKTDKVVSKAYPLKVNDCIANALQLGGDQKNMPLELKMNICRLVQRILLQDEVVLTEADLKLIKDTIVPFYNIQVLNPLLLFLESES